jgi:hypothetical protein
VSSGDAQLSRVAVHEYVREGELVERDTIYVTKLSSFLSYLVLKKHSTLTEHSEVRDSHENKMTSTNQPLMSSSQPVKISCRDKSCNRLADLMRVIFL